MKTPPTLNPPTLKSIASACGVSHVTVWRALKGHPSVHPETAHRVREYAREVGWKGSRDTRIANFKVVQPLLERRRCAPIVIPYNLRTQLRDDPNLLFWDYVTGCAEAAESSRHPLEIAGFRSSTEELERIRNLVERGVGGILDFGLQSETIDYIIKVGLPFVSLELNILQSDTKRKARVYSDHIQGFLDAWRLLNERGHQRIGFIGYSNSDASKARINEGLAAAQLLSREQGFVSQIFFGRHADDGEIWEAFTKELGEWPSRKWPTAFFCTNDECGHLAMACFRLRGVVIPRDVSIIGFDDTQIARLARPGMTTIGKPCREIGASMFRMLGQMLESGNHEQALVQAIPMSLVERESVTTPRK